MSEPSNSSERGIALLLALFVIVLATILVFEFARRARFDQAVSRSFSDGIRGDYILKSGFNLGRLILELPKLPGANNAPPTNADWLGELWNMVQYAESLPLALGGDVRLAIIDEDGKIDLNWLLPPRGSGRTPGTNPDHEFWRDWVRDIFTNAGFQSEAYDPAENRTPGNIGFDPATQVATIIDFIDRDSIPYTAPGYKGIESAADRGVFYNRYLNSLNDLLMVPGMTVERLGRIAPYVKVAPDQGTGTPELNINTVPDFVLLAYQDPATFQQVMGRRASQPIVGNDIQSLPDFISTQGPVKLSTKFAESSKNFSIIVRFQTASSSRWLRALVSESGGGGSGGGGAAGRKFDLEAIELY